MNEDITPHLGSKFFCQAEIQEHKLSAHCLMKGYILGAWGLMQLLSTQLEHIMMNDSIQVVYDPHHNVPWVPVKEWNNFALGGIMLL